MIRSPLGWCYKQLRDVWPVSPVLGPEFMSSLYSKCSQLPSFLYPNPWLSSVLLFFQVIKTISNRVSIISQIFIHYILNKVSAMCLSDHIQHFFVIYTENNFSLLSPEAHREACNFNCTILKAALARIQKHLIIYTFFNRNSCFGTHVNSQTPEIFFSFSQISSNKRVRILGICITPNYVFLTNLGQLKTLESHNSLLRRLSGTAPHQQCGTGYPAIERGHGPGGPPCSCRGASRAGLLLQEDFAFPLSVFIWGRECRHNPHAQLADPAVFLRGQRKSAENKSFRRCLMPPNSSSYLPTENTLNFNIALRQMSHCSRETTQSWLLSSRVGKTQGCTNGVNVFSDLHVREPRPRTRLAL